MIACDCDVCTSNDSRDKRLRTSILVESSKTTIVIDTTPDFRYQMLRAKVKKLDAVLFTHPHKDHIAGLDDVRAYNFFQGQPVNIYANALTEEAIKREFAYAFSDRKYPGVPDIELNTITTDPFSIGDIYIIPILVWHLKMPVLAFRFGKFTYITDANRIDDSEIPKARGSEVIVLNALRQKQHISHYSLNEAIEVVESLEIPNAYFIHLSHQMGKHKEIESKLPEGMHLAYDGLKIQVN
jgi:phosphoribosyl 1,2-cyclic phosphate phosphodiesterase